MKRDEGRGLARVGRAFSRMVDAVRRDYETQCRFDAKYGGRPGERPSLVADLAKRAGLQLSAAYRVMRFFDDAHVPLAPKVMSRLIRHLYGSDIHWKADIEPGVMLIHGMGLAISSSARVGAGVALFHNVTLGMGTHPETRESGAPTIEADVHVGPGAVIIGPVTIGARSKVMANCVVTRSIPPDSLVEAPAPTVRGRKAPAPDASAAGPRIDPGSGGARDSLAPSRSARRGFPGSRRMPAVDPQQRRSCSGVSRAARPRAHRDSAENLRGWPRQ